MSSNDEYEKYVDESVELYAQRVNDVITLLKDRTLDRKRRDALEKEKKIMLERRIYWKRQKSMI